MQQQSSAAVQRGEVVWFDDGKGYGFIRPEGASRNAEDVYVHFSAIDSTEKRKKLHPCQKVEFEVTVTPRGPAASKVKVLEEGGN